MLKFCMEPGCMTPMLGSTLKGGCSGLPIRSDIMLGGALAGWAPVNAPADLLPGREMEVSSVIDNTCPLLHFFNIYSFILHF